MIHHTLFIFNQKYRPATTTVARIESGKIIPKLDTIVRLLKQLGLKLTVSPQKPVA